LSHPNAGKRPEITSAHGKAGNKITSIEIILGLPRGAGMEDFEPELKFLPFCSRDILGKTQV
jgi:hypothetical protein